MAPRRSHTKSRNGCVQCKHRRIKCDEQAPVCTNCIKHSVQCNYTPQSKSVQRTSRAPRSQRDSASPSDRHPPCGSNDLIRSTCMVPDCATEGCRNAFLKSTSHACEHPPPMPDLKALPVLVDLQLSDLELLHHFSVETYKSFRGTDSLRSIWKFAVPQLAFRFPYLMQSLLAISALHLSHLRPAYRDSYLLIASSHQHNGLADFRSEFNSPRKLNSEAAFCFSSLVVVYAFGGPKTPGSLGLAESGSGISEWLDLVRGIYLILYESGDWLHGTPLRGLVVPARPAPSTPCPPCADPEVDVRISDLFRLCSSAQNSPSFQGDSAYAPQTPNSLSPTRSDSGIESETLQRSITELQKSFFLVYSLLPGECQIDSIFRWPLSVPQSYIVLLTRKHPTALIILAHFCVLLHRLEVWWMQGWPDHMLRTIETMLDQRWHSWLQWPISVVRNLTFVV